MITPVCKHLCQHFGNIFGITVLTAITEIRGIVMVNPTWTQRLEPALAGNITSDIIAKCFGFRVSGLHFVEDPVIVEAIMSRMRVLFTVRIFQNSRFLAVWVWVSDFGVILQSVLMQY